MKVNLNKIYKNNTCKNNNYYVALSNNLGITLIALVITIIVLLILAGVSIAMLTGQNGILTQAQNAKQATENAAIKEENDLLEINDYLTNSLDTINVKQVTDDNPGILEQDTVDNNTYIINSIEDLVAFSYNVRNGNEYEGKTIRLGSDLDFNSTKSYVEPYRTDYTQYGYNGKLKECLLDTGWIPIGDTVNITQNNFKGTFDGNNKNIYHLLINQNVTIGMSFIGLFANNMGNIENLNLKNIVSLSSGRNGIYYFIGGISGNNQGNIINCTTTGDFQTQGNYALVSGISARNEGTIELSTNYSKISGKSMYIAGISAQNLAQIKKCANFGEINSQEFGRYIGGIAGLTMDDNSSIQASFNNGNINVNKSESDVSYIGGIAGQSMSNISNCYNNCTISSTIENFDSYIGGICGLLNSSIQNCYSHGKIVANSNNTIKLSLGGIIGAFSNGDIKNVYNDMNFHSDNSSDSITIGNVLGLLGNISEDKNLYFYGENEAIGDNLNNSNIQCTKFDKQPTQSEILNILNSDSNMFQEDTTNRNEGYPLLNWQTK